MDRRLASRFLGDDEGFRERRIFYAILKRMRYFSCSPLTSNSDLKKQEDR